MRGEYYLALVDDLLPDIVTHVEQLQQLSEVCAPGLGHAANQTCKRCLITFIINDIMENTANELMQ